MGIMVFSRKNQKTQALGVLIRHAKQLAINGDSEFKKNHNDEVKDAIDKNFTKLVARVTKKYNDNYNAIMKYRETHWK
jgi:hypothetical protein